MKRQTARVSSASNFFRSSKVKTTSAAENGWPSEKSTPLRRPKTSSPSCQRYDSASQGTDAPVTGLWMSIGSYIEFFAAQRTSPTSRSGLKLRMKAAVCSVSVICRTPSSAAWRRGAQLATASATPSAATAVRRALGRRLAGIIALPPHHGGDAEGVRVGQLLDVRVRPAHAVAREVA